LIGNNLKPAYQARRISLVALSLQFKKDARPSLNWLKKGKARPKLLILLALVKS
jgi:hypothetical protein